MKTKKLIKKFLLVKKNVDYDDIIYPFQIMPFPTRIEKSILATAN